VKKILIDCTPIRERPSGVGFYAYNLIKALTKLQDREDFIFGIYGQPSMKKWLTGRFTFPKLIETYPHLYLLPLPVTITNLLAKYSQFILTNFDSYLEKPDLIHGTDHYVYPCRNTYKVMTIHDLTFLKYPSYSNLIVKTYTNRIKQCLQWTDLVITFSESSQRDIQEYFGVTAEKIYITPEASRYSPNFLRSENIEKLKASISYDFSQPYLLFVSTLEPRKNIVNLIGAFNLLKQEYKIPHHLILIGQKGWHFQEIFKTINSSIFKEHIHHLGYLSDELVALFYTSADVFVYPSFYEGFGLPVLEAMTLGAPVVTSNTSSLPEVAGDAAILVNPYELTSIAKGIYQVINDSRLRQELINRGQARARLFSWEKTAKKTLKAYKKVLT
jgi:glycosyltransferase involved in cell wall biosynthesis